MVIVKLVWYILWRFSLKGDLQVCHRSLRVLYLQNNQIRSTASLNHLTALTHLYLQNNCIEEISGLEQMPNLQKLFLSMNRIRVLKNLRDMPQLRELHIERQMLDEDAHFSFDTECMDELAVWRIWYDLKDTIISVNYCRETCNCWTFEDLN